MQENAIAAKDKIDKLALTYDVITKIYILNTNKQRRTFSKSMLF